jgi:phenylalanyl-tRNA synthetase beta chain
MSVMRTTLLGSLLDVARRNRSRGMSEVRLFEIGSVFLDQPRYGERTVAEQRSEPLPEERTHVAALVTGPLRPASWREPEPPQADFFAVKAVMEALLETVRVPWRVERGGEPFLHPGRAARVIASDGPAGWIGEIHPAVARAWDLDGGAVGFEIDLEGITEMAMTVPGYRDLTPFPAVIQDRAWWFAPDVQAWDVLAAIRLGAGKLLRNAEIFDVYPAGDRVSLAVRLEFRADDRTLTDEEVARVREKIDAEVAERLGGEPRG